MFNDLSSPAALLHSRRSGKPRDMVAPGPDRDQLTRILQAATRVPDHGKLAPWRFLIVPPSARPAFAEVLRQALLAADPDAREKEIEAAEQFAVQAPTLIVVFSSPKLTAKIPQWEQELSVGASCMALLAATHAEGYVGGWLTGWPSYSPQVAEALGAHPHERIAGFIFIGTAGRELEERPRPALEEVVSVWQPS